MNAVWIALIAVFAALIPVFIFAAKANADKKAAAQKSTDSSSGVETGYIPVHTTGSHKSHQHEGGEGGESGGGDGGGGGGSD